MSPFSLITNPFYTKDFQFFLRISVGGKEKCTKLQSNKDARGGKADFSLCFDEWKYFSIQVCHYSELLHIPMECTLSDVFTEFMCSDLMLEYLYHTVMLILYTVLISSFIREQRFNPKHWSNLYSAIFQFSKIVFVWCAYVFSPTFMPVFESFFFFSDTWAEFQSCESQSNHGGASFLWARSKRSQTNGQCFLQRFESSQCMAVFCFVFWFFCTNSQTFNQQNNLYPGIHCHSPV